MKITVGAPKQTTGAAPHKLLDFFLGQCAQEDFDSTKTMIALAKWAEYLDERDQLREENARARIFEQPPEHQRRQAEPQKMPDPLVDPADEYDRTSTISSADLDIFELQKINMNLVAHPELIEAIDELIATIKAEDETPDAVSFLKFLKDMKAILTKTLEESEKILSKNKIRCEAPDRTDQDQKKSLSAALRLVWERFKAGIKDSFAVLLEAAFSCTPAEFAKHDLIWVMNDFRKKGIVNETLLEQCLLRSFGQVRYGGHWDKRAQFTVLRLMEADESERGRLLEGIVGAMQDLIDSGNPEKAREGFLEAVHHIWNGMPHPLLKHLSRDRVDSLAVMRELLHLSLSGKKIDESMLWVMNRSKLSQAYKNTLSYREIQELIDDLVGALDLWQRRPDPYVEQQGDPERESDETKVGIASEREFITHLSAINEQLQLTWTLLKRRCEEERIGIASEAEPLDPSEKKLIEDTLKAAFSRIDRHRPVGECIEEEILFAIERERQRARRTPELAPLQDHFNSTGVIEPEFEDLIYAALKTVGVKGHLARVKLAEDARLGVMKLTAGYGGALLDDFSKILSDTNFGPTFKDKLLGIIGEIDKIAEMPGARIPIGKERDVVRFDRVQSVEEAAGRIHDLNWKVLQFYPDEELADAVQSYLREQGVTPEMARDFLRYANRARLEGRSAIVRQAIRDFLPGKVERPKISDQN